MVSSKFFSDMCTLISSSPCTHSEDYYLLLSSGKGSSCSGITSQLSTLSFIICIFLFLLPPLACLSFDLYPHLISNFTKERSDPGKECEL